MKKRRYQKRKLKNFLFVFATTVSVFVFFAACIITFLEVYSFRENNRQTANTSAPLSSASSAASEESGNSSENTAADIAVTDQNLILVNYDNKLPDNYDPDLITVYGVQMNRRAAEAYKKMNTAAATDGISLWISSAYRSPERQEELFDREVADYAKSYSSPDEAEAYAEKSVARPGYSEHSTGLALDLNGVRDDFYLTDAYQWLGEHAQEYGFVLRYPKDKQDITKIKYEPWHYRYVGEKNAKAMKGKNMCMEEYLEFLQKKGDVH